MVDQSTNQDHWSSDHWSKSTRLLSTVRNSLVLVLSWSTIPLVLVESPVYQRPGPGLLPGLLTSRSRSTPRSTNLPVPV